MNRPMTLIENTTNMIIHIEQIRRKTVSRYTIAKMSYEQYRKERLRNFENQERQAESERREKKIHEEKLKRIRRTKRDCNKDVTAWSCQRNPDT